MDIYSIITLLAIIVALFREEIRNFFISPKLYISLHNPIGELVPQYLVDDGIAIVEKARYYHLLLTNLGHKEAIDSQVFLTRLEEFNSNNVSQSLWEGEIAMNWKDDEIINSIYRTISPKETCDLCYVTENKRLHLCTLYSKTNLNIDWVKSCNFIIHLYVKYKYKTSQTFKFRIKWDGQWEEDDNAMTKHLIINKI